MAPDTRNTVLDVSLQPVAAVYAQAFLGAAETAGRTAELVDELDSLVDGVLDAHPELEQILASQFVSDEEKLGIIDRVFGGRASELIVVFLKVISGHGRLDCMRAIRREVQLQYHEMQGRVEVTLTTASPIESALVDEIAGRLRDLLDAEPNVAVRTDPSLLAGAVVRVGDTIYDGSVRTQLRRLRSQMVQRTIEQIGARRDQLFVT